MASRKFYDKIAGELLDARPPLGQEQLVSIWAHCVVIVANNLSLENASFKRGMFYEAAGVLEAHTVTVQG